MTQEDKELLLKDLSARLPYGVICKSESYKNILFNSSDIPLIESEEIKPYLRPISSMTDKECEEYRKFSYYGAASVRPYAHGDFIAVPSFEKMDWLNAHHFDYRGLIEKGLAIEVTEENNPYKE